MDISIVIPCYNSTPILRTEIELCIEEFKKLNLKEYEIVLVNDGSPNPDTIVFLESLVNDFKCVKLVDLAKNTGQANAQLASLNFASGDLIINMDDDMQTHPKNIPILYHKINEGYDLVLGKYPQKKHSRFRNFLSASENKFEAVFLNKPKDIIFTSFWIVRRYIVDEMIKYHNPYAYLEGLFLRTAGKICNVEVEHFERQEGASGYNLFKLIKLWSNFTGYTVLPLRIADGFGIVTGGIGVLYAIITIIRKLLNPEMMMGYASIISLMLIYFGITLFCIGIVGEYVGRTFMSVTNTPQFVVKRLYNFDEPKEESVQEKKED